MNMKKEYIKPETLLVELILESSLCCSCTNYPDCGCDDDEGDEDDGEIGGTGSAGVDGYRLPIWDEGSPFA